MIEGTDTFTSAAFEATLTDVCALQMKSVVVKEFVNDASEEWEMNEEGKRRGRMKSGRRCEPEFGEGADASARRVDPATNVQRDENTEHYSKGEWYTDVVAYVLFSNETSIWCYPVPAAMREHDVCCRREGGNRVKAETEGTMDEEVWRGSSYLSQKKEKEVFLKILEKENLCRADVEFSMKL
ncbi:uncharacterized protein MONOS_16869 [Monocercomonoides exilis]|uniref:uncharacterized protein n=1 Tax=Monocercomonoides exilis TaxID=2049356 RepID=UPI00355AC587|nr:hypothetical protein MONOS_16869 [Monocercomonoides exilis]